MQMLLPFYRFASVGVKKKNQPDMQADSDHRENVCLSYLDIHFKHLNQAVLNGPHPLLIENTGRAR